MVPYVLYQVEADGRRQYLSAACMGCLEGWTSELRCLRCTSRWSGSELILGTMYSYDIFAATPCCADRLRVSGEWSGEERGLGNVGISLCG